MRSGTISVTAEKLVESLWKWHKKYLIKERLSGLKCQLIYIFDVLLQHGSETVEEVFRAMFYFMRHNRRDIQSDALHAIGFVCVHHHKFMLESKLKMLYIDILTQEFYPEQHKTKVLNNIESFLIEEEAQMIRNDKICKWFFSPFH